jgi:hypothetical protein
MATTIRKTAKFYREELIKKHTTSDLETLIKEICTKFGGKDKSISLWNRVEFNWNHRVEGFRVAKNGQVLVKVYWQGDSTDGDDYVYFTDVLRKGTDVIRAVHHWLGDRTYEVHSDIRVEREEVESLVGELAKWLSPSEIKERKINNLIYEMERGLSPLKNDLYNTYYDRWNSELYYNGIYAIDSLIKQKGKDLIKLPMEQVKEIARKVFLQNKKSDSLIPKESDHSWAKKIYDISY